MADATATVAVDSPRPIRLEDGSRDRQGMITGTITIVDDYATGGVSVSTNISKYFKDLRRVLISGNTFAAQYDYTNNKVLLYGDQGTAALGTLDEPNGVTLTSTVFDFIAIGRM